MIAMFGFVFTLGFAKVPAMPQDQMMDNGEKPDFDSYRFLLDQRNKARRRAERRDWLCILFVFIKLQIIK